MACVDLVADVRAKLGESPVWCARTSTLYHVDINGCKVWATRDGRTSDALVLPEMVGCVVPRARGGLLACLETAVVAVDVDARKVGDTLASVPHEHRHPSMRFNDGKVDPSGRHLVVGTMHTSWRDPAAPTGKLYCVSADHGAPTPSVLWSASPWTLGAASAAAAAAALAASRLRGRSGWAVPVSAVAAAALAGAAMAAESSVGVAAAPSCSVRTVVDVARVPNGMAWTSDARTLFWIDSATQCVEAFDWDGQHGALSNRRTVVTVPRQGAGVHGLVGGIPDGCTIDAAGKLWVALAESGCVVQYDPETQRQLAAVQLPVQRPTACTFGGADLSELYCTTREEGAGGATHAGGLFRVRIPGVKGLHGAYAFSG